MKIAAEIKRQGVEMMLVRDTVEAAVHALSKGWILESDVGNIAEEKKEDEARS
jgi:hypothetical protein